MWAIVYVTVGDSYLTVTVMFAFNITQNTQLKKASFKDPPKEAQNNVSFTQFLTVSIAERGCFKQANWLLEIGGRSSSVLKQ